MDNLCLHFSPRFKTLAGVNTIECSSRRAAPIVSPVEKGGQEYRRKRLREGPRLWWNLQTVGHSVHTTLLSSAMAQASMIINNIKLHPGQSVRVQLEVDRNPKQWAVNLGKDINNLCLHFNPRSKVVAGVDTIVCNSRRAGNWEQEHREPVFPFEPGCDLEVCFTFDRAELTIMLPNGHIFKFPNRLNMDTVDYVGAGGDIKIKSVSFE
ncbi:galectin-1-like [Pteronotus mesoamericanus]|uniref:galectin-1-like n=1 Tax=Pteronotus mesoamericanus TaxID=1884717 RepID=UPI0023EDE5EE|nr:galectin-1-like [Pteronotus parnellii mesoamericanus]